MNLNRGKYACLIFFVSFLHIFTSVGHSSAQTWYTVKWVNDGDTIVLLNGQRVRYIGINTPEIDHENQKAEPFGYEARSFNHQLIFSKRIRLEFDQERHDQYGRLLAYVFLENGSFVNAQLLQNGFAYYLYRMPNVKYKNLLLKSQQDAMNAKMGIWQNWIIKTERIIGNRKSRRFHLATCPFAKDIKSKNRIIFSSKWDAFQAGYAPARNCVKIFWSY